MAPVDLLLDQLPEASAQTWHDEGLACRLEKNASVDRLLRARRLLTFSALLGKSSAKYQLGVMNLRGEACPADKRRAAMWFKLAIARDESRAQGNLAMVAEDLTQFELKQAYTMAADFARAESAFYRTRRGEGDAAVVELCELLMQGVGIDPDPELAVAWLRRGALARHPGAQWLVGMALATGRGVPGQAVEGRRLLQQAADRGHAGAQHELGEMLMREPGPASHAQAIRWFEAAARQDYLPSLYRLGVLYKGGEAISAGTEIQRKDVRPATQRRKAPHLLRALDLLGRAASKGHADAQYELGQMHAQGLGTKQDFQQALHCYLQAAAQGHAKAQFNLGFLHSQGQGVEQDYVKAYQWYATSAASGYTVAAHHADYIGKKLTPEELELAQWRADSYRHREGVDH